MKQILKFIATSSALIMIGLSFYGLKGWADAHRDSVKLKKQADILIATGLGADSLDHSSLHQQRLGLLIKVQDPSFYDHSGVDLATHGAGITTLTQSLAKRLAFDEYRPGIGKIRQTAYAIGLDQRLTKDQQIALFLDTVEMGKGPQGWVTGFHKASETFFGKSPKDISDKEFRSLLAVMIAPGQLKLSAPDTALEERTIRIAKLARNECEPDSLTDVWLEGCK